MTVDPEQSCVFCGTRVIDHDPISVRSHPPATDEPAFYCNYACLSARIEEQGLHLGDACAWNPE
ncbi:hypothetical protein [Halocatena halophila]|uniref:hypothetical protein n=1 Tax=Halocatena halophila TaxID=2814576 RepID=UPI002ECFEB6D